MVGMEILFGMSEIMTDTSTTHPPHMDSKIGRECMYACEYFDISVQACIY